MASKQKLIKDIESKKNELINYIKNSKIKEKENLNSKAKKIFDDIIKEIKETKIEKSELNPMNDDEVTEFICYYKDKLELSQEEMEDELDELKNNYEEAMKFYNLKKD